MGWIPDFDEQEEDNSESEDEQSVGFIKEDFDGSDVEKEGDNNVNQGNATDDILYKRMEIIKDIQEAEKVDNLEALQKAR
ncbi:hypothetical protein Tco_0752170 [Tanacetum coccineum]|uniref:Uncharacterized protein n=1 Tax=Tanacetum coccineum TaxID=301880 RepID=A0ABQ4Z637_9ASTR